MAPHLHRVALLRYLFVLCMPWTIAADCKLLRSDDAKTCDPNHLNAKFEMQDWNSLALSWSIDCDPEMFVIKYMNIECKSPNETVIEVDGSTRKVNIPVNTCQWYKVLLYTKDASSAPFSLTLIHEKRFFTMHKNDSSFRVRNLDMSQMDDVFEITWELGNSTYYSACVQDFRITLYDAVNSNFSAYINLTRPMDWMSGKWVLDIDPTNPPCYKVWAAMVPRHRPLDEPVDGVEVLEYDIKSDPIRVRNRVGSVTNVTITEVDNGDLIFNFKPPTEGNACVEAFRASFLKVSNALNPSPNNRDDYLDDNHDDYRDDPSDVTVIPSSFPDTYYGLCGECPGQIDPEVFAQAGVSVLPSQSYEQFCDQGPSGYEMSTEDVNTQENQSPSRSFYVTPPEVPDSACMASDKGRIIRESRPPSPTAFRNTRTSSTPPRPLSGLGSSLLTQRVEADVPGGTCITVGTSVMVHPDLSGQCSLFKIMIWTQDEQEKNGKVFSGLVYPPVPALKPTQIVSTVRSREAILSFNFSGENDVCGSEINLTVSCFSLEDNTSTQTYVAAVKGGTDIQVIVKGLVPRTNYTCLSKSVTPDGRVSACTPISITTTNETESKAPVELFGVSSDLASVSPPAFLMWADNVNSFSTRYVIEADRRCPQPACCKKRQTTFNLFTAPGQLCCGNLQTLVGKGRYWAAVRPVGGDARNSSEGIEIEPSPGLQANDTLTALQMGEFGVDKDVTLMMCPPCENFQKVHAYAVYIKGNEEYLQCGYCKVKRLDEAVLKSQAGKLGVHPSSCSPIVKSECIEEKEDGSIVMKMNLVHKGESGINWCRCQRQLIDFRVKPLFSLYPYKEPEGLNSTSFVTVTLKQFCPDPPSTENMKKVKALMKYDGTVALSFPRDLFSWKDIEPNRFEIVVSEKGYEDIETNCSQMDHTVYNWKTAFDRVHVPQYRTSPDNWNPFSGNTTVATFVIGSGLPPCNQNVEDHAFFCNGPLREGLTYSVRIRAYFQDAMWVEAPAVTVDFPNRDPDLYFVWVLITLSSLAIYSGCLIINYCCAGKCSIIYPDMKGKQALTASRLGEFGSRRSSNRTNRSRPLASLRFSGLPGPYTMCEFRAMLRRLSSSSPEIRREFQALSALSAQYAASTPSRVGRLPQNAVKNRYSNVVPFDHNRVRLLDCAEGDDFVNYINASYIEGYTDKVEYIAAQGPKDSTTRDFWFMVFQQNVRLIIMLTKLVENDKVKCHQYYPELGDRYMWGDLVVECSVQNDLPAYTLRTIVMKKGPEQRLVHHLHFREWPDFGCPASTHHVLQFCMTVRQHTFLFPGMMLVHCSAGVGRTGTLIAVDILLQRLKAKKKMDVFGVVMGLREQRISMVQSQEQYWFIYQCLKKSLEEPRAQNFEQPFPFILSPKTPAARGLQLLNKLLKCN